MSDQITELIHNLLSPDESTRRFAVEDLGDMREVRAVEPLVPLLFDPTPAIREAVVDSLKSIGGEETVLAILPALRSDNAAVRNAASEILQTIGEPAIPHLKELLQDDDKDVRKFAVDIMAIIGSSKAEEAFIEALDDRDVNVAAAAAEAIGEVGSQKSVAHLVHSLKASTWIRCSIAKSLGQLGGEDAATALQQLLADDDPMIVYTAVEALGETKDARALESLLPLLQHENPLIMHKAISSIEQIEDVIPEDGWKRLRGIIPLDAVVALTRDPSVTLRQRAIAMLGRIGSDEALEPILDILLSKERREGHDLRELAMRSLVLIDPADLGPIFDRLDDETTTVEARCELVDLLGQLGRSEAFETVARFLEEDEVILQRVAARSLVRLAPQRAATSLRKALRNPDDQVRFHAACGLAHAKQDLDDIATDLSPVLDDSEFEVRQAAARSLAALGTDRAIECLLSAARSDQSARRHASIEAMADVCPLPEVNQILTEAISDPDADIAAAALRSLTTRGRVPVNKSLLDCLKHPAHTVRCAAIQLLAKQEPDSWTTQILDCFREDPAPQVRHDCALALATFCPPETVEILIDYLEDDPHPLVALGAIEALGQIGDEQADPILDILICSDDPEIVEAASQAMDRISQHIVLNS